MSSAEEKEKDHLSSLPDDLLHQILSFIPSTRFHTRTSVLSKLWSHLWTNHPNLHLHICSASASCATQFYIWYLDRCLDSSNRATCLKLFHHIRLPPQCPTPRRHLSQLAPLCRSKICQESCHPRPVRKLPESMFGHAIHGFPNLITLSSKGVIIPDKVLASLLHACPLLETLKLVACKRMTHLEIHGKNLPNSSHLAVVNPLVKKTDLIIHSPPNRRDLYPEGDEIKPDRTSSSSVLTKAKLCGFRKFDVRYWTKLVHIVSNVTVLNVDYCFFKPLYSFTGEMPTPRDPYSKISKNFMLLSTITDSMRSKSSAASSNTQG